MKNQKKSSEIKKNNEDENDHEFDEVNEEDEDDEVDDGDENDAKDILRDDEKELDELIREAQFTHDLNGYLKAAIKATQLADLYFEALDDFSGSYFKHKLDAAEMYEHVAKDKKFINAELMAALMLLQANQSKKAKKIIDNLSKRSQKGKGSENMDDVVIQICQDILNDKPEKVAEKIKIELYKLDSEIKNEVLRTIKYVLLHKKNHK
jgi:hypothetical protein